MILLITNKEDMHPNAVTEHLRQLSHPIFRLNTDSLLTDYEFCWRCEDGKIDFYIKNIKNGKEVLGKDIHAVWERRPVAPTEIPISGSTDVNEHNLDEAGGFLNDLRYFLSDRYCIGHALFDRHSEAKIWQAKVASDLGMKVPDTVISNRKEPFVKLAKKHSEMSVKPIDSSSVFLKEEQIEKVFYVRKIGHSRIENAADEEFSQTVTFIQAYIPKLYELRVTVVHDRIFACKIDSQQQEDDKGKVDWRQGYDFGLKLETINLPIEIQQFCLAYLKRMHLNFGCFDFIVTPDEEYIFLECNPNGQWYWIEIMTKVPISKAISEVLIDADLCQIDYNNNDCY